MHCSVYPGDYSGEDANNGTALPALRKGMEKGNISLVGTGCKSAKQHAMHLQRKVLSSCQVS